MERNDVARQLRHTATSKSFYLSAGSVFLINLFHKFLGSGQIGILEVSLKFMLGIDFANWSI
ncbi:hypothetical protein V1499_01535 [Neobacillus sp. SCS-31]|uniref:hypothetical protein n=1 Tax=Neobacillus oceani TaxID=3115292 RepID=UPI0039067FC5